jgi:hypothetical protein
MNDQNSLANFSQARKKKDIPHMIKWILLIILVFLLFLELYSGEYKRLFDQWDGRVWIVILIKLILIIGIIILMRVQRSLKCQITAPTGCTEETPDAVKGILYITVEGTAAGGAFGFYTLEIQKGSDPPYPAGRVSYPGGGVNGTIPVLSGILGTINTTDLSDGAYTITLRVNPAGSGPATVCTTTFNLLKIAVWINSVGGVAPTPNIFNEDARLKVGVVEQSFGGSLAILGSAYIYECANRKVEQVEMRYAKIPFGGSEPMQPANKTPMPAAWPVANVGTPLVYNVSNTVFWTRIGAAPTYLLNTWGTCLIGTTSYPSLVPQDWNSRTATSEGMFLKLLLAVKDTAAAANIYYDTQKVWIDNYAVIGQIVKFQRFESGVWIDIPHCTDILLSWGKLRIIGLAWDALIDPAYPADRPNDNFKGYGLTFAKQFGAAVPIPILPADAAKRVPAPPGFSLTGPAPTSVNAGVLAEWDLSALDAGDTNLTDCPDPVGAPYKLYRNCECTYTLTLTVSDYTIASDYSGVHAVQDIESLKIVNDLNG